QQPHPVPTRRSSDLAAPGRTSPTPRRFPCPCRRRPPRCPSGEAPGFTPTLDIVDAATAQIGVLAVAAHVGAEMPAAHALGLAGRSEEHTSELQSREN